jgi:hypothetical protein
LDRAALQDWAMLKGIKCGHQNLKGKNKQTRKKVEIGV